MKRSPSSHAISISTSAPSGVALDPNTAETGYRIIANRPLVDDEGATVADVSPRGMAPVPFIAPVDSWVLHTWIERDSDGFRYPEYAAVRGGEVRHLNVSRFRFSPSQDRFAWLVRNGFPQSPGVGPWDDTDIEMRMAIPAVAA